MQNSLNNRIRILWETEKTFEESRLIAIKQFRRILEEVFKENNLFLFFFWFIEMDGNNFPLDFSSNKNKA